MGRARKPRAAKRAITTRSRAQLKATNPRSANHDRSAKGKGPAAQKTRKVPVRRACNNCHKGHRTCHQNARNPKAPCKLCIKQKKVCKYDRTMSSRTKYPKKGEESESEGREAEDGGSLVDDGDDTKENDEAEAQDTVVAGRAASSGDEITETESSTAMSDDDETRRWNAAWMGENEMVLVGESELDLDLDDMTATLPAPANLRSERQKNWQQQKKQHEKNEQQKMRYKTFPHGTRQPSTKADFLSQTLPAYRPSEWRMDYHSFHAHNGASMRDELPLVYGPSRLNASPPPKVKDAAYYDSLPLCNPFMPANRPGPSRAPATSGEPVPNRRTIPAAPRSTARPLDFDGQAAIQEAIQTRMDWLKNFAASQSSTTPSVPRETLDKEMYDDLFYPNMRSKRK